MDFVLPAVDVPRRRGRRRKKKKKKRTGGHFRSLFLSLLYFPIFSVLLLLRLVQFWMVASVGVSTSPETTDDSGNTLFGE